MGILKLALIGGAGYLAVKKLTENNRDRKQHCCQGGQQQQQQSYPDSQYHGEKPGQVQNRGSTDGAPANNTKTNSNAPQQSQQFYDFEPNYQQNKTGPSATAPAYAEGGEQRKVWNEKGEYHRSN